MTKLNQGHSTSITAPADDTVSSHERASVEPAKSPTCTGETQANLPVVKSPTGMTSSLLPEKSNVSQIISSQDMEEPGSARDSAGVKVKDQDDAMTFNSK